MFNKFIIKRNGEPVATTANDNSHAFAPTAYFLPIAEIAE